MKLLIKGKTVRVSDKDLLGRGGEASVYRHQNRAVKVYHTNAGAQTQGRFDKLASFPTDLPASVLGPIDLVHDAKRAPAGFTMSLVEDAEDLKRLANRRFREGVIENSRVLGLFRELHTALSRLHDKHVVVGDLNDANVVFDKKLSPFLIDTDSIQFGPHRCLVAHDRFLDPRLYGVDFTRAAVFTPQTDWFAFSVMLFQSLLYVHPYGGVTPKHGTLARRAEAGHSILKPDVKIPKAAIHWRILPDELLGWFELLFDKNVRDVFPARLLNVRWTKCACGLEHARPVCPECAKKGTIILRAPTINRGRCRAVRVVSTAGRIVFAQMQANLRYLVAERGILRRESGQKVLEQPLEAGMRFSIAGRATWLGLERQIIEVRDESAHRQFTTGRFGAAPMFASNSARTIRLEDQWLVDVDSGTRLGSVLEQQTWFSIGERLGYGFYRAGRVTVHFLFRPDRPGLQKLEGPSLDGRLIELDAVFDDRHVLVSALVERSGRSVASVHLFRADGVVIASICGDPDHSPVLSHVTGKALLGGRILMSTEVGLMSVGVDTQSKTLCAGDTFVDTEPFVAGGDPILPGPGGSIYVIKPREITQLTLA